MYDLMVMAHSTVEKFDDSTTVPVPVKKQPYQDMDQSTLSLLAINVHVHKRSIP
jgi:hypothetical protein